MELVTRLSLKTKLILKELLIYLPFKTHITDKYNNGLVFKLKVHFVFLSPQKNKFFLFISDWWKSSRKFANFITLKQVPI